MPEGNGHGGCDMRLYLRAVSYFRQDLPLVAVLLVIIFASAGLGLLMAWPMAILIDSVLTTTPRGGDLLHRALVRQVEDAHTGDKVEIQEHRPLSRDKRWIVSKLIARAKVE